MQSSTHANTTGTSVAERNRWLCVAAGILAVASTASTASGQSGLLLNRAAIAPQNGYSNTRYVPQQSVAARRLMVPRQRGQSMSQSSVATSQGGYSPGGYGARTQSQTANVQLSNVGYYIPQQQARQVRVHDIVNIRVEMTTNMQSEGNADMRRSASYDAVLTDWIILNGLRSIKPSPQSNGDPRIAGALNRQNRAEGGVDTRERLQFNIAAEVTDIYPNGNLALLASSTVRINNENWRVHLSGVCRADDIGPDNTVLSKNIAYLNISKKETGQVRDAYRRGWFTRILDRLHPF